MKRSLPLIALALIVLAAAGWFGYSCVSQSSLTPDSLSFEGQPIGNTPITELSALVDGKADEYEARSLHLSLETSEAKSPVEDIRFGDFVSVDRAATLRELESASKLSVLDYAQSLISKQKPAQSYFLKSELDEAALSSYVSSLAAKLNRPASNKGFDLTASGLKVNPGQAGFSLDEEDAKSQIVRALGFGLDEEAEPVTEVILHGAVTEPITIDSALSKGSFIYVDLAERMTYLYRDGELVKSYPVAVGKPGYATPKGNFKITLKRRNPVWGNPGSAWAKDMPQTMGPSANSPLGLRALNINSPGIRLHGTADLNSIGKAASHGCVRLSNVNIVDLFDRVETGTPVYIR